MIREHPILFSGPMVRAILDGRKTQTRRTVKTLAIAGEWTTSGIVNDAVVTLLNIGRDLECDIKCPYGKPGDRLWVRETWDFRPWATPPANPNDVRICYGADAEQRTIEAPASWTPTIYGIDRWRPSIHMPRWASRITLEVVSVGVERLHTITEADAKAEGVRIGTDGGEVTTYFQGYADLWMEINGEDSWAANPWVWVVEFKRVQP